MNARAFTVAHLPAEQVRPGDRVYVDDGYYGVTRSRAWGTEWRIDLATGHVLWVHATDSMQVVRFTLGVAR